MAYEEERLLKIALLSPTYPPVSCGVGDYGASIVAALRGKGHEVDVIVGLSSIRSFRPDVKYDACVVNYQVGVWTGSVLGDLGLIAGFSHFARRRVIVILHDVNPPGFLRRAGRLGKLMWVLSLRHWSKLVITNLASAKRLVMFRIAGVCHIPVGSTVHGLAKGLPPSSKVAVSRSSQYAVFYFGLIEPSKRIEVLLQGVACADRMNIELRIAGAVKDDRYVGFLQHTANSLGVTLVFLGKLSAEAIVGELMSCDLFAPVRLGGTQFSTSTTFMAGLVQGVPMIVTGVPEPELGLEHRVHLHVTNFSANSIGHAIVEILENREYGIVLANNAQKKGEAFSWGEIAARLINSIEDSVTNSAPRLPPSSQFFSKNTRATGYE